MADTPIDTRFLDALASAEPTPGGGSASALAGAIAAGLVSMVCNLTRDPARFPDVHAEMERTLAASEALRARLMELVAQDMAAYGSFAQAQRLPRGTAEEKSERNRTMQSALKQCLLVPMSIVEACREVLWLCPDLVAKGNPNAVSDVGVGAVLAEAALRGAAMQVQVNMAWLKKDAAFVESARQRLAATVDGTAEMKEKVVRMVEETL